MKQLSRITESFGESVIREMTRVSDQHGAVNLSQGFPDFPCPPELKRAAARAIEDDLNQYPVTFGERVLREAIATKAGAYNRIDANPATEVTVTCGATEAMIATMKAIMNPGDEFVLFEPFYENYGPDGILSGATPRYVRLEAPSWRYDSERLKEAFDRRTKAIVINTPNNPTGKVFTREELREIADLCIDHDVFAITDEIYEHILYDGRTHVSIASMEGMAERTVTINSLSKTYSVTGWRVGWAIAAAPLTERIRKVHDFLTVGAPTPLQHAGVAALGLPQTYYDQLAAGYARARDHLMETLQAGGFVADAPAGAYYVMADGRAMAAELGIEVGPGLARRLVERLGVATVPGESFYSVPGAGEGLVRFCFCKQLDTLERARERLWAQAPKVRVPGPGRP